MKNYSDNIASTDRVDAIDKKQSKQIMNLRLVVAGTFVVNLLVSLGLFFATK